MLVQETAEASQYYFLVIRCTLMTSRGRHGHLLYLWIRVTIKSGQMTLAAISVVETLCGSHTSALTTSCVASCRWLIALVWSPLDTQVGLHARTFTVELGALVGDVEYLTINCHVEFSRRSSAVKLFQLCYAQFTAFLRHSTSRLLLLLLLVLLPAIVRNVVS